MSLFLTRTRTVILLSVWQILSYEFGIRSFMNSCVWGFADDLLKIIDNEYCRQDHNRTYNYRKRNRSTSHVHMMLSTALIKMMDQCECILFLNTPSSIPPDEFIEGTITDSPWIYSEIAMTSLIQKKAAATHRELAKSVTAIDEGLRIKYEVQLAHITALASSDLKEWQKRAGKVKGSEALDALYMLG